MVRVVIDTNVLVSGLLSANGNEASVILAVRHGAISPCLSAPILDEYRSVLSRRKFSFDLATITALIDLLLEKGTVVSPRSIAEASPDPADTKFIQCAMSSAADYLVTGNKRDFPARIYGVSLVVNARELIDRIVLDL